MERKKFQAECKACMATLMHDLLQALRREPLIALGTLQKRPSFCINSNHCRRGNEDDDDDNDDPAKEENSTAVLST